MYPDLSRFIQNYQDLSRFIQNYPKLSELSRFIQIYPDLSISKIILKLSINTQHFQHIQYYPTKHCWFVASVMPSRVPAYWRQGRKAGERTRTVMGERFTYLLLEKENVIGLYISIGIFHWFVCYWEEIKSANIIYISDIWNMTR